MKSCICLFSPGAVQSVQRPAAAVRVSAPVGSPRRVAPFKLQQEQPESLQKEPNKQDQQKERNRQAEEQEKEVQRDEVSSWKNPQPSTFPRFYYDDAAFTVTASEAAGSLSAAREATETAERRTEEDVFGFRSPYYYYSALLPQGTRPEYYNN